MTSFTGKDMGNVLALTHKERHGKTGGRHKSGTDSRKRDGRGDAKLTGKKQKRYDTTPRVT